METKATTFKEWLLLAESIDANMGQWLGAIVGYAKPEERRILDDLVGKGLIVADQGSYSLRQDYDAIVKAVLKEKRKEDSNWLSFSLGYLSEKAFRKEDLEMAIDVLEQIKAAGEITRANFGQWGWMLIGASMPERISEHSRRASKVGTRESVRLKKEGKTTPSDERLIKKVAEEGAFKLYYLEPVSGEDNIESRHRVLCRYGKGTQWCTANAEGTYHKMYADRPLFIVHKDDQPLYQFVDCREFPEAKRRSREDYEQDGPDPDAPIEFKDAMDEEVYELAPDEERFLRSKAPIQCYGLVEGGFEGLEDFMSADEYRVRTAPPKAITRVMLEAGDKVGEVVRRFGPAMSRAEQSLATAMKGAKGWGPGMADSILDALAVLFHEGSIELLTGYSASGNGAKTMPSGIARLFAVCLAESGNPWAKTNRMIDFVDSSEIALVFQQAQMSGRDGGLLNDEFLTNFLNAKKDLKSRDIRSIVPLARDTKKMLGVLGGKLDAFLSSRDDPQMLYNSLAFKKDGSADQFAEFLESRADDLRPEAYYWAVRFAKDKEACAKRLLSRGPDDQRIRMVFSNREVRHLLDDSHVSRIAKGRDRGLPKDSESSLKRGGIVSTAFEYGGESDESIERFLRGAEEVDGHEVMSALFAARKPEEMAARLPKSLIDKVTADDLKRVIDNAERVCSGSSLYPAKPRAGCREGSAATAVMKRTDIRFPMDWIKFMGEKDRDEVIIKNLRGADPEEVRRAMDLAHDKDKVAEAAIEARGGKATPGEITSILVYVKDKKKFLDIFGDDINSLDAPYESYDERDTKRGYTDFMGALLSSWKTNDFVDDILGRYRKPLSPEAVFGIIKNADDQAEKAASISSEISALDGKAYSRLRSLLNQSAWGMGGGSGRVKTSTLGAVDDARKGRHPQSGDRMNVESEAEMSLEPEDASRKGERVVLKAKESRKAPIFVVTGVDGENIEVTPEDETQVSGGSYYSPRSIDVKPGRRLKGRRESFVFAADSSEE